MKWPKLTTSSTKKETRAGDELRIDYTTEQNNDSKKGENKIRDEQLTPLKNIQNPAEWLLLQHSRLTHVPDQQIARPSTPTPSPPQPPPRSLPPPLHPPPPLLHTPHNRHPRSKPERHPPAPRSGRGAAGGRRIRRPIRRRGGPRRGGIEGEARVRDETRERRGLAPRVLALGFGLVWVLIPLSLTFFSFKSEKGWGWGGVGEGGGLCCVLRPLVSFRRWYGEVWGKEAG